MNNKKINNNGSRPQFAFTKTNYILMAVSFVIVVIGFVLMSGGSSTEQAYDPSIFDARHIKVAPMVTLAGFVMMIVAIMWRGKRSKE